MITFCINTARNERYHVELLFKSLHKNLSRLDYPIIVYIENDNQNTSEFLVTQKAVFPNLKIIKNPLPLPIGYGRNINLMFEMAKTDIVSYLQSDMVVCKNYDLEILKFLTEDTIVSSTRIEPPLHPPSNEKITHDFGLDPKLFDLNAFTLFAESQKANRQTDYWFAPFTLYKKVWNEIGGHDTLFRRSREDSDLLYRFSMVGLKTKQAWNAIVYHFTCTSSRGPEWWTEKAKQRTRLQQIADSVEMMRFLKKWPSFKHTSEFDPLKEYKYYISANLYDPMPLDGSILQNYYRFNRIYIDHEKTRDNIRQEFDKFHDFANALMDVKSEDWNKYKKYFNVWNSEDIFPSRPIVEDDIILDIKLKGIPFSDHLKNPYYETLNDLAHSVRNEDPGQYIIEEIDSTFTVNKAINHIRDQIVAQNPVIDFEFEYL